MILLFLLHDKEQHKSRPGFDRQQPRVHDRTNATKLNQAKGNAAAEAEIKKTERARIANECADKIAQDLVVGIAAPVGNMRSCRNIHDMPQQNNNE
jgi:signal transduction histidine kinase